MMVFAIMLILLLYSVQNVTFKEGSASAESMALQINLEEKNLANAISNAISQVYAQGPGAKTTTYVKLTYLRDSKMISRALGIADPVVFITYGNYSDVGNGTYVTIIGTGFTASLTGKNKNVFWSQSMYSSILYTNSSVWSNSTSVTFGSTTVNGLQISPAQLPPNLQVVVTWDPAKPDEWTFNSTKGALYININLGG